MLVRVASVLPMLLTSTVHFWGVSKKWLFYLQNVSLFNIKHPHWNSDFSNHHTAYPNNSSPTLLHILCLQGKSNMQPLFCMFNFVQAEPDLRDVCDYYKRSFEGYECNCQLEWCNTLTLLLIFMKFCSLSFWYQNILHFFK